MRGTSTVVVVAVVAALIAGLRCMPAAARKVWPQ
jgi:hypothetical protein